MTEPALRVFYVGTLPPHQGGSAIMAAQLLRGLVGLGHDVEAIAPITEQALRGGDPLAGVNPGWRTARFTMPYLDISPVAPPDEEYVHREREQIQRLFGRSMADGRADVVIIGRESFTPHVVDLARRHSLPSVLLFAGATTMGILSGTYPRSAAGPLLESFRRVDVAVTSARHMHDAVRKFGLADVRVIPNPVDLEQFRPMAPPAAVRRALRLESEHVVVAHLSNLKPIKRPLDFAEAAAHALLQEPRLVFVVVGDGPCRRELEEACGAYGISQRFRFTGWLDHARIPQVLSCVDIVVLPSAGEAQALAYLEAQACGRTLLASDIPAAREVIQDGRTGLLHRTADPTDLAAKILLAAGDPDLRARIGRAAIESAAGHALPDVVSRYSELLQAVSGREAGARTATPSSTSSRSSAAPG